MNLQEQHIQTSVTAPNNYDVSFRCERLLANYLSGFYPVL